MISKKKLGGIKSAAKIKRERGVDYFKELGKKAGSTETDKPKGFAANKKLAKRAGKLGGAKSKRGKDLKPRKNSVELKKDGK